MKVNCKPSDAKKNVINENKKLILTVFFFLLFLIAAVGFDFFSTNNFVFHEDFKQWSSSGDLYNKHVYIWSDVNSAVNIDGIMRFYTRFPIYLFSLLGNSNIAISYFYIVFSCAITFFSFFIFMRDFLKIEKISLNIIFSLMYVLNPVFLGNFSKIGLMYAASALPLMLVCIKKIFDEKKYNYFFVLVLIFLFSQIHPFTTLINVIVAGSYFFHKLLKSKTKLFANMALKGLLCMPIFAFFILPVLSVGSVSKEVISSTIGTDPGNLLLGGIAKTDGLKEAFVLSKSVFLDYHFFNEHTKFVYIFSAYLLVLITFYLLYKFLSHREGSEHKAIMLTSCVSVLFFIFVSTGNSYFLSDLFYNTLISSPFAWFFRSPLKWQIYIPFFFTIILSVGYIHYLRGCVSRKNVKRIFVIICASFTLSIVYLVGSIFFNLFIPKYVELNDGGIVFAPGEKALLVFDESCRVLSKEKPKVLDETLFYFFNNDINLTRLNDKKLLRQEWIYDSFQYVVVCDKNALPEGGIFSLVESIDDDIFIYEAMRENEYIKSIENLYVFESLDLSGASHDLITSKIGNAFHMAVGEEGVNIPATSFKKLFESGHLIDSEKGVLRDTFISTNTVSLILEGDDVVGAEGHSGHNLLIGNDSAENLSFVEGDDYAFANIENEESGVYEFTFRGEGVGTTNLIQNPSLEEGLWKENVGDCYNYDDSPVLEMNSSPNASDGEKSLELISARHLACTGPPPIDVRAGAKYQISFSYQSENASRFGYNITFDDTEKTVLAKKINLEGDEWQRYSEKVTVPDGAKFARLTLYSYPKNERERIVTRYDDFSFVELPDLKNSYFVVSESDVETTRPDDVEFDVINPTKKYVNIRGAIKPFYLTMNESYHDKWELYLYNEKMKSFLMRWVPFVEPDGVPRDKHFKYMTFLNGWYVDPVEMCGMSNVENRMLGEGEGQTSDQVRGDTDSGGQLREGCVLNADGSYDIEMMIEFMPQRWFYVGLLTSVIVFFGIVFHLTISAVHARKSL